MSPTDRTDEPVEDVLCQCGHWQRLHEPRCSICGCLQFVPAQMSPPMVNVPVPWLIPTIKKGISQGLDIFKRRDWDGSGFDLPGGLLSSIWEGIGEAFMSSPEFRVMREKAEALEAGSDAAAPDAPPELYSCGGARCDKGYTSPNCGCTPPEPDDAAD